MCVFRCVCECVQVCVCTGIAVAEAGEHRLHRRPIEGERGCVTEGLKGIRTSSLFWTRRGVALFLYDGPAPIHLLGLKPSLVWL